MGLDAPGMIDPGRPLTDLGLDSLMAVELRNSVASMVETSLPATLLFNYPSLDALTAYLLDDVLSDVVGTGEAVTEPTETRRRPAVAEPDDDAFDDLSEDEIADMLAAELEDVDE